MEGKKYFKLTPGDLRQQSVWVLSMDVSTFSEDEDYDDDSGMVVPLPNDPVLARRLLDNCICYVRTSFVAANGRQFLGIVKCGGGEGVEGTHPSIATDEGQVPFYLTILRPSAHDLAKEYARLGTSAEELFPLEYHPEAPPQCECPGGVLHGFYYLESHGREYEIKSAR